GERLRKDAEGGEARHAVEIRGEMPPPKAQPLAERLLLPDRIGGHVGHRRSWLFLSAGWRDRRGRLPENPLTPVTSGGGHVRRARARAGTAPLDDVSPQGYSQRLVPGSARRPLFRGAGAVSQGICSTFVASASIRSAICMS